MLVGAVASNYRYGAGQIHFSDFYCSGNEPNITSCPYANASTYCTHANDVGVTCRGMFIFSESIL